MKFLAMAFLMLTAFSAHAVPNQKMIKACWPLAVERLSVQAEILDCTMKASEVAVADVDDRFYNPNKYIWYTVPVSCEDSQRTTLTKMIQYKNGECF